MPCRRRWLRWSQGAPCRARPAGRALGAIPLGISIVRDEVPGDQVIRAVALVSATLGIGGALALPMSATLARHLHWHGLFWFSAVVAVLAILSIWWVVPASPLSTPGRIDLVGAVGMAIWLVALLLVLTRRGTWGWSSAGTIGTASLGACVLAAWIVHERRASEPLVDVRLAASRAVVLTHVTSVLAGFTMYASLLILPQLLQAPVESGAGLGLSMVVAGWCFAPCGALTMLVAPLAARLSRTLGARSTLSLGLATMGVGYGTGTVLLSEIWHVVLVACVVGAGVGLCLSALPVLIMSATPHHQTAEANGLNALMRTFGTAVAAAVVAAVLQSDVRVVAGVSYPGEDSFHRTFVISAAAAVIGAVLALAIPRRRSPVVRPSDLAPIARIP